MITPAITDTINTITATGNDTPILNVSSNTHTDETAIMDMVLMHPVTWEVGCIKAPPTYNKAITSHIQSANSMGIFNAAVRQFRYAGTKNTKGMIRAAPPNIM
jgi:hypothetical protein